MAVGIQGEAGFGVTQPFGHCQDIHTVDQHLAGGGMPQVVKADIRQGSGFQEGFELLVHSPVAQRGAVLFGEDQVFLSPIGMEILSPRKPILVVFFQDRDGFFTQHDGPDAGVDQDVTVRDVKGAVQSVRVADGDDFHKMKLP